MANVLKICNISSINGLPIHLGIITVEKQILCCSLPSVLKTVKCNFKNSGNKEDYLVNISFAN
jgi:hypothetical protein